MRDFRPAAALREGDRGADQTVRLVPASAEIAKIGTVTLGYWNRPRKPKKKTHFRSVQRLAEAFIVLNHRYDGPVETDDGDSYLEAFAQLVAWNERGRALAEGVEADRTLLVQQIVNTCSTWLPGVEPTAIDQAAAHAADEPKKYTADQFANAWAITFAERTQLGLRTIGACDLSKPKRKEKAAELKKEKDRVRASEKRRAQNARPQSNSDAEFCRQNGLAIRTFKRHKTAGSLEGFLTKKGCLGKWHDFVADIGTTSILATKQRHFVEHDAGPQAERQPIADIIDLNISEAQFDELFDQTDAGQRRAASRAAAAQVSRKAHIFYSAVALRLSDGRRLA